MDYNLVVRGRGYESLYNAIKDSRIKLSDEVVVSNRVKYQIDGLDLVHGTATLKTRRSSSARGIEEVVGDNRSWKVNAKG